MKLYIKIGLTSLLLTMFAFIPTASAATSPQLGAAASYSVLAGSAITNTGATTISGDAGISPGIGPTPHYTGFGTVTLGGSIHDADGTALTAQSDRDIAYATLGSQTCNTTYAGTKDLVGENLVPGVYCANAFQLTGTLTLNGSVSSVWIFKSASSLVTTGSTANIVFTGGGQPCNVWWRVVSTATFDAGSKFVGNILADTSITVAAGSVINGRLLASTAAVTLDSTTITGPTCATSGGGSSTLSKTGLPNTGIIPADNPLWIVAMLATILIFIVRKNSYSTNR